MHHFHLSTIQDATNGFSLENKLGEGGFGPVYLGKLVDGREIAVKRLSKNSSQGLEEFMTEVRLIIKLQHKNLVKLLGCCIKGDERLLVYEYMVNTSLDSFLFDPNKAKELNWIKREKIICGVAKGLRYLHEDSRLKIIHRDLKTSNILLDDAMDPKISDFGTARIFGTNQIEAKTNIVVGTYGYMAPEYAMEGLFSTKSDVYSFGVLLLEIIHGRRNNGFYFQEHDETLLSYAWRTWKEGRGEELIDKILIKNCALNKTLRLIHIALLCVQEDPKDRPNMSSVVFMLEGQWSTLPEPSEPPLSFTKIVTFDQVSATDTRTLTTSSFSQPLEA
ncbi:cysteine-rich receptor-like protein kinase 10 [Lactuca sativa]|nr:cysteine-rich receptor-like protein kinase 10 [Lactuca sativa]